MSSCTSVADGSGAGDRGRRPRAPGRLEPRRERAAADAAGRRGARRRRRRASSGSRTPGPGLAEADTERAFERFYLHERYGRERQVGTGLGLAIVKELTLRDGRQRRRREPPGHAHGLHRATPRAEGRARARHFLRERSTSDDVERARTVLAGRVHRTPLASSSSSARRLAQGGAVPEDRLVQGARRAQPARRAHAGGAGARRRHVVGRQPRAGRRVGGARGGRRLPRRRCGRA